MPIYCYRVAKKSSLWERILLRILNLTFKLNVSIYEIDDLVQLSMTIEEKEHREKDGKIILDDGSIGLRDIMAEHSRFIDTPACWGPDGLRSDAAGVNPDQIPEAYDESVKLGVPTEFCPETGQAIFRDRTHRKKYLRAIGLIDRDGGYGDPT